VKSFPNAGVQNQRYCADNDIRTVLRPDVGGVQIRDQHHVGQVGPGTHEYHDQHHVRQVGTGTHECHDQHLLRHVGPSTHESMITSP
jgi:hypothetical protein